ncbi:flavin reductase family protein [Polymorphum gilvum]|uniref:Nitrilotriacetate monooxygenase component B n=1 Tax=Polymorphum gilvum (strain LMG 25793 / CGMCC 1.9160 / SL003B-26A1) TaxID=991905 RepID=F2J535_POLGS|nr:flavin reductase family protein [Polymorphum gilvum]ADZ70077.1 Nitrilotriacetate monooxygenase component B [Polymorphum gilvum SL003B-26A1]
MFYQTARNDHGLRHDPFKALVAPRPIGWISTLDREGRANLAPYSFFNAVCDAPPMVMFSSLGWKDSVANIEATGEFVCNLASLDLKDEMNASSAAVAPGQSEFELAGLAPARSVCVRAPRVARAKAALECRHLQTIRLTDLDGAQTGSWLVIGQVLGIHIADEVLSGGRVDIGRLKPLARLGYKDYCAVTEGFAMERPVV